MLKRPPAPVMPKHEHFTDEDGYVDYEAYDHAIDGYRLSHDIWWDEHGLIQAQMELAFIQRERELSAGAR